MPSKTEAKQRPNESTHRQLPDSKLLALFWDVSSDVAQKQLTGAKQLCEQLSKPNVPSTDLDYCADRLVKGLAASKYTSRLGFSQTLTLLLRKSVIKREDVIQKAQKLLPMKGDDRLNECVGRGLAYLAILNALPEEDDEKRELCLKLVSLFEGMRVIEGKKKHIVDLLCYRGYVLIAGMLHKKDFSSTLLPVVEKELNLDEAALAKSPDQLWLLLHLQGRFAKKLPAAACALGSKIVTDIVLVENILKHCASLPYVNDCFHPVCSLLVSRLEKGVRGRFFTDVVMKNFLKSSEKISQYFGFELLAHLIETVTDIDDVDFIWSHDVILLMVNILAKRNVRDTFLPHIDMVFRAISAVLKSNKPDDVKIRLVRNIAISHPHFDHIVNGRVVADLILASRDIAPQLLVSLVSGFPGMAKPESSKGRVLAFLKLLVTLKLPVDASDHQLVLLKFLGAVSFLSGSVDLGMDVSVELPGWIVKEREPGGPDRDAKSSVHACAVSLLDECCVGLCKLTSAKGRSIVELTHANYAVLWKLARWLKKMHVTKTLPDKLQSEWSKVYSVFKDLDYSAVDNPGKGIALLAIYGLLWSMKSPEVAGSMLDELLGIQESRTGGGKSKEWLAVCIDLMIGLLSVPNRFLRVPVQVAFFYLCDELKSLDQIQPLIDVIDASKSEQDLMKGTDEVDSEGDDGDEEDDDRSVSDDDVVENGKSSDPEWEDFSSDGDDEDEQSEKDMAMDVDPEFREKLRVALAEAGMGSAEGGDSGAEQDLDDDAMMRLDDTLAEVFRTYTKHKAGSKIKKQTEEELRAFRNRVFDLLNVFVQSGAPASLRVSIHPRLVQLAQKAAGRKVQSALFDRTVDLANRLSGLRFKWDEVSDVSIVDFLASIMNAAQNVTNPKLKRTLADGMGLCLRIVSLEGAPESAVSAFVEAVEGYFEKFAQDRAFNVGSALFSVCLGRAPEKFVSILGKCGDFLENPDVSIARKRDICELLLEFFSGNMAWLTKSEEKNGKTWKKFSKKLRSIFLAQLDFAQSDPDAFKQRYFGLLFNLVIQIGRKIPTNHLNVFSDSEDFIAKLTALSSKDEWSQEPLSRSRGIISSAFSNKQPHTLASTLLGTLKPKATTEEGKEPEKKKRKKNKKKKSKDEKTDGEKESKTPVKSEEGGSSDGGSD